MRVTAQHYSSQTLAIFIYRRVGRPDLSPPTPPLSRNAMTDDTVHYLQLAVILKLAPSCGSKLPYASIAYLQWVLCLVMKSSVIDGNEWANHLMATHRADQCRNVKTANNFVDEPQYLIHMTKFFRFQDNTFFSGILLTKYVRLFVLPSPDTTTDKNITKGWFLRSIILIWNALCFLVILLLLFCGPTAQIAPKQPQFSGFHIAHI